MSMECQWNEKVPRQEGPPSLRSVTPSACGYELDELRPLQPKGGGAAICWANLPLGDSNTTTSKNGKTNYEDVRN